MNKAVIGIDIGGTDIKAGIVNQQGMMLKWDVVPTEASSGKEVLLARLVGLIREYRRVAEAQGNQIVGAGIGTAGFVHFRDGVIAGATGNLPGWGGTPLRKLLEEELGIHVAVDNDINAIALGESWLGAGRGDDCFICIAIGTGIGGCLVVNGEPYRGRDGYAGLYGHQIVVHQGKPCNCGKQGCWEQYASVTALKQAAAEVFGEQSPLARSPIRLFEEARAGNQPAVELIDQFAEYVAVGLTNVIHTFNPRKIIIGGAITAQGVFLFDRIRRQVERMALQIFWDHDSLAIIPAQLGEQAGVFGAGWLAWQRIT